MGSSRERKHGKINFDFLQKLGKVLMTVIAVMPAAGLMISLGKLVQMAGADASFILTVGSTMENIGWAVINNLHILFAVAIGGSWAKERAGGAFAAVISFILINQITGSVFGVTADMLNDPDMQPTLEQLVGIQEEKPFECVGSRDEINTAIVMTIDNLGKSGKELPYLLKYYKTTGLYEAYKAKGDQFSSYFDKQNLVPTPWEKLVEKNCKDEA